MQYKLFKDYRENIKKELNNLKVIYSDLDGTLLNDKGCLIKDENNNYFFETVRQLGEIGQRGWDIVLASGRNRMQLRYNAQMIGVKNYIAELGTELVYNLGEKIYTTFDTEKIRYDLKYGGKDLLNIVKILKGKFPDKIESNLEWSKYRSNTVLFLGEVDLDLANSLLEEEGYKGLVLVDNGLTSLERLDIKVDKLHIYNLIPSGVDKSSGIKLDKRLRGFDTENCIALGDSIEDLKMASEVQFFFLMRNAIEHKKEILGELVKYDNVYVTENRMNRGWAEVIGYLL